MRTLFDDELLAHLMESETACMQLAERLPFFPSGERDFQLLVQDVSVDVRDSTGSAGSAASVGVSLEAATRRMLHRFWRSFGTGDRSANGNDFDGVRALATEVISAEGHDGLIVEDLKRLVGKARSPSALWANELAVKHIRKAYFDRGLEPEYVMVSVPDGKGGSWRRPSLAVEGVPVYSDGFYPSDEQVSGECVGTSIYAMSLGEDGFHGAVPASFNSKMVRVKEVLGSSSARITYRVYWPVALRLRRPDALVRLHFCCMRGME